MSDLIAARTRTLRFIACGGTAINLLRNYRDNKPKDSDALSEEHYSYVDTSIANLKGVSNDEVYLLQGVDGSGSDRPKNAKAIKTALPEIMVKHGAADFNIVIFSAAGGTGSVAGPMILEHLLGDKKNAIAIVIGSHDSLKRTTNTIGTLQGLEAAVARLGRPIVMHYKENELDKPHAVNNRGPQFVMQTVSMLTSGKNDHLDSADVNNLFNFHTVTHHAPSLAMLNVYANAEQLTEKVKAPIAFAALVRDSEEVVPQLGPDYDTVGYLPSSKTAYDNSFYFVVTTDALAGVFTELNSKRENATKQQKVQAKTTSLLGGDTKHDEDTGLVF